MSLPPLNRKTTHLPQPPPEKIVQFGAGNFLRGFVDWIVDQLNETANFKGSIVVVKPLANNDYQQLRRQEGLFHVQLNGLRNGQLVQERHLSCCISRIIHPWHAFEDYLALAERPSLQFVISNTTESGIVFDERDSFTDSPPNSFPGKLTRWLYHRYQYFDGSPDKGLIFFPCELIDDNGACLKETVVQFAEHWGLTGGFKHWLDSANTFCNTLVDRIVTGYPQERGAQILAEIGYDDTLLTEGELYHSWVIEGSSEIKAAFPTSQTNLNVRFVEDLTPYRLMKVRLLNGAHTAMVPVGYLAGFESVREVIEDEQLGKFVRNLLEQEVMPPLPLPQAECQLFIEDTLERFRNPTLRHRLLSIALNSITKFRTRLLPSLLDYVVQNGRPPPHITMALAALIRFYRGDRNNQSIPLQDDPATILFLQDQWTNWDGSELGTKQMVTAILSCEELWLRDLTAVPHLTEFVTRYLLIIEQANIYHLIESVVDNG